MTLIPGSVYGDGRFELAERIAIGGMGEIWCAYDRERAEHVALKVVRPEFAGDATLWARLRAEARNASRLRHPNIASVHEYWEENNTAFLSMELVEGPTLADVLAEEGTLPPARLIPILIQCAKGLQAAHAEGIIHRDVKPGNIIMTAGDHVKLTDFGISVSEGQTALTATGKVMGTAHYLAPELALGRPATTASDMYALGIIAYESLAGRRPFSGSTHVEVAMAQVRQPPPPLPDTGNSELNALVMRLLAKNPVERPEDCARLATLLSACTTRRRAGTEKTEPENIDPPDFVMAASDSHTSSATSHRILPGRSISNPYGAKPTRPTRENDTVTGNKPTLFSSLTARQKALVTRAIPLLVALVAVIVLIIFLLVGGHSKTQGGGITTRMMEKNSMNTQVNVELSVRDFRSVNASTHNYPSMERFV